MPTQLEIALDRLLERDPNDNNLSPDELQIVESAKILRNLSGVRDASKQEKDGSLTWISGNTQMEEGHLNELRKKVERVLILRPL
jgi:hypothetical protein